MKQITNSKTAIILGATGLTGGLLTELLLKDSAFAKVKIFTRHPTDFKHGKIEEIICDLLDITTFKEHFTGDAVFCCIGTTKAQTPDREKYRAIDYGIPINTAQLAKENGISTYMVISSAGTSAKSPFFYVRTKGEMEQDLIKIGLKNIFIIKPAFINGRPDKDRKGEKTLKTMMAVMDFFMVGPLKKWKSTQAVEIATSMAQLAKYPQDHINIENQEIKTLSSAYGV